MPIYAGEFDADALAGNHIFVKLAARTEIEAIVHTNSENDQVQVYPRRAPQGGSTPPYIIYARVGASLPLDARGKEYVWEEALWLVKAVGFDWDEDNLARLNKLILDTLHDEDVPGGTMYVDGQIVECVFNNSPVLPDEPQPGGEIIINRGSEFNIIAQPL